MHVSRNFIDKTTIKYEYFDVHSFCKNDICLRKMLYDFTTGTLSVTIKQCFFKSKIIYFEFIIYFIQYIIYFNNYYM